MRLFIGSEELRETDDEIFITFGRALYVAQDFEENCRFLASSLGVFEQLKSGVLSASEEELSSVFGKLSKKTLYNQIERLESFLNRDSQYDVLDELRNFLIPKLEMARKARNRIAHSITHGCMEESLECDILEKIHEEVYDQAKAIADANFFVCALLGPLPRSIPVENADNVAAWVCQPIKSLI